MATEVHEEEGSQYPDWEEPEEPVEEKRFRMANLAVFAIQQFCASLGEEMGGRAYDEFHAALRTPGGYFQWTPSNPTFKRITVRNPRRDLRPSDWSGNLAVVIDNRSDSVNRELTERLNAEIKRATFNAWIEDEDL